MNWCQIAIGFVGYASLWSYPEPLGMVSPCTSCHRISHSQVVGTLDFVHPQSYPPCSPAELGSRDCYERHFFYGLGGGQPRKLWGEFLNFLQNKEDLFFFSGKGATEASLDMKQCFLYEIHWFCVPGFSFWTIQIFWRENVETSTLFMDHP